MKLKLTGLVITLFVGSLIAHDNFNKISTNVNPFEFDSSYLKLDHQSHFYSETGDVILLHLTHAPHLKYFQSEAGVAYRKFFPRFGVGANVYYMNTTQPSFLIHQVSPGLEMFYKDFQVSYNFYMPTSSVHKNKKGLLIHSPVSEFGIKYFPRRDLNMGLIPFYDHQQKEWGLNAKVAYAINDRFEVSVAPFLKKQGSGCTFSFGFNFGSMKTKLNHSVHRSNDFSYSVIKSVPKIYVKTTTLPLAIGPSIDYIPILKPTEVIAVAEEPKPEPIIEPKEEVIEEVKEESVETAPHWWEWNFFKREEQPTELAHAKLPARISDFYFLPPWVDLADSRHKTVKHLDCTENDKTA